MTIVLFHFACYTHFSLKIPGTSICIRLMENLYSVLAENLFIYEKVLLNLKTVTLPNSSQLKALIALLFHVALLFHKYGIAACFCN